MTDSLEHGHRTALRRVAIAVLRSVALYVGFVVAWQFSMFVNLLIVPAVPWMLVTAAAAWWYLANWAIGGKWDEFAPQSESNWSAWAFVLSSSALAVLIFPLQGFVTGVREYLPVPAPAGVSPLFAQCFVIIAPVYFGMVEEVAFRGVLQRPVIGSFGFAGGVLLIAALFIVWHLPLAQFEYQYVGYTVMALSLGFLAATSGSLKLCVMSHGFTNLLLNALIVAIGWPALMKFYAERLIPLCLASSVLLGIAIFSGRGLWVSWRR